jgi:hypothetical protein
MLTPVPLSPCSYWAEWIQRRPQRRRTGWERDLGADTCDITKGNGEPVSHAEAGVRLLEELHKRFGFEPEVTAKISRVPKVRIYEVGISYYGRTYEQGKKIGWKDGVWALYCIAKYNMLR